ncbi:hypothetical protein P167DRAFT_579445 [Morchella conica CCBAS932]|uniref:Uncharacterized protein n=1 Tax=Morchella conica CCBAS932 TaxID=1392247 RepID=A0A3N4K9W5_9PEZI|nr:hypothetical protein P167DRAFT_579445 [Morchella conica CCBAS932]
MTTIIEGWLQIPPERNLIGRAAWKIRYVKFGSHSPTTPTSARSAISPTRPTTATGVVGPGGTGAVSGNGLKLSQTPSDRSPQSVGSMLNEMDVAQLPISLTVYKQKNDTEPIIRYPITSIASCYIGDVASRHKKKSVVLPTLVVNLRPEIQLSSSKSFRRRSHDVPGQREGAKREGAAKEILLFRPGPDNVVAIEKWAKEIQAHLIPSSSDSNANQATDPAFRERFSDLNLETPTTSSSMFFMNGEPNTALLSPSLRSRTSNLSSIESDDKGSLMSSSASDMPSPNADEEFPRSSAEGRPPLHLATKLRHSIGAGDSSGIKEEISIQTPIALPPRRETILDRFFSTAPPSPALTSEQAPMNSIARFEALIRDIEYEQSFDTSSTSILINHPRRIPSPTQRALEFVSSGLMKHSPENLERRPSTTYGEETHSFRESQKEAQRELSSKLSVGSIHRTLSRQASEASLGTTASMAGSTGGGVIVETNLSVSNSKRHSLADFSLKRLSTATPPMFPLSGPRRGSHSDIPRISETGDEDDQLSPLTAATPTQSFGHSRVVNRPLFKEFSF